jgi:hypothetical protein
VADALLIPAEGARTELTIESIEKTINARSGSFSWQELSDFKAVPNAAVVCRLPYRHQTDLWASKTQKKLETLNDSTNSLVCAEDLGQLTDGLLAGFQRSGLLGLRAQRMAKELGVPFRRVPGKPRPGLATRVMGRESSDGGALLASRIAQM